MRKTLRALTITGLAALLVVGSIGAAFALDEEPAEPATIDLEAVKERVVERLEARIDRMQTGLEELADEEGPRAEQMRALLAEGIEIFSAAAAEVAGAESLRGIGEIVRDATVEFRDHAKVRRHYAHVGTDLVKFERRIGFLDEAIDRADTAGFDTTAAVAEAEGAVADLATAAGLLETIDPSTTGSEVMDEIAEAHRTAHEAQQHVRAGFEALREVLPSEAA